MNIYVIDYAGITIVRAEDPEAALAVMNQKLFDINEAKRWEYKHQIDGGGRAQRRDWRQYIPINIDSVTIKELSTEGDPEIIFDDCQL